MSRERESIPFDLLQVPQVDDGEYQADQSVRCDSQSYGKGEATISLLDRILCRVDRVRSGGRLRSFPCPHPRIDQGSCSSFLRNFRTLPEIDPHPSIQYPALSKSRMYCFLIQYHYFVLFKSISSKRPTMIFTFGYDTPLSFFSS